MDIDDTRPAPDAAGFADLGLDARVTAALTALGYEEATPVQRAAIPALLAGHDVLAQAATGTGKTAAFTLPLLHRLQPDRPPRERTAALVLVPTRELAMQVAEAVYRYGKSLGVVVAPLYGGAPMEPQIRVLARGADVVVATPGRALDHVRRGTLALGSLRTVVLDEADEMLDMGFAEDLEAILAATPAGKQVALFSATMAPRIAKIAETHLREPVRVTIDGGATVESAPDRIRQVLYVVGRAQKMAALGRILDVEQPASAIVFCRTRTEVDALTETLAAHGLKAEALHGGLSQDQRDRVMKRFRTQATELLVATDVAARGLDVQHVSHVVNFDVPSAAAAYVHRIGRTGRAGRTGVAITLAEPREQRLVRNIERVTGQRLEVAAVPSVAALAARRAELAQSALRTTLEAGGLGPWREVVATLASEHDLLDVAAAALKQAVPALDASSAEEILPADDERRRKDRPREFSRGFTRELERGEAGPRRDAVERHPAVRRPRADAGERAPRPVRAERFERDERPERERSGHRRAPDWDVARVYIGAGRQAQVRPADLVAAIAREAGVSGPSIGAVRIWDRHSIVEVPASVADTVIRALSDTTIRGKRVLVRRDREG